MPLLYYVQNSTIGITILAILLYYVMGQGGKRQPLDSLFILLLFSTILLLSLEMSRHIFQGRTFLGATTLHTASALLFFLFNPLLGYFYFLYIDQMQNRWWSIPFRLGIFASIPLGVSALFSLASLTHGMVFSIDGANLYARGPYFFIVPVTNMFYLIAGQVLNAFHMKQAGIERVNLYNILIPIPLLVVAILQAHFEQVQMLYIAVTFTLLVTYLHIQNTYASRDYLTTLYNRSVGDQSLAYMFLHREQGELIGGISMDIDSFKEVNDHYGHDYGDRVLRNFSHLLTESFSRHWVISRYGGDEFFLFRKMDSPEVMEEAIIKFKKDLDNFNTTGKLSFPLSVSFGRSIDADANQRDPTGFLKRLDQSMYRVKRAYHSSLDRT